MLLSKEKEGKSEAGRRKGVFGYLCELVCTGVCMYLCARVCAYATHVRGIFNLVDRGSSLVLAAGLRCCLESRWGSPAPHTSGPPHREQVFGLIFSSLQSTAQVQHATHLAILVKADLHLPYYVHVSPV